MDITTHIIKARIILVTLFIPALLYQELLNPIAWDGHTIYGLPYSTVVLVVVAGWLATTVAAHRFTQPRLTQAIPLAVDGTTGILVLRIALESRPLSDLPLLFIGKLGGATISLFATAWLVTCLADMIIRTSSRAKSR